MVEKYETFMDIKDTLVSFYVKKYVIPRALVFDKPGFIDFKISGKTRVFARQFLVPQNFFVTLEERLIKEKGDAGASKLYSIGKRFGYSFAQLGRFENINDHPGESVKDWLVIATKFVEGTYASGIAQNIDVKSKTIDFTLTNFAVCEKLGYDHFLATGGAAGVMAWILQSPDLDAKMYSSEKTTSDQISKVLCAPVTVLKSKFSTGVFSEADLTGLSHDAASYEAFNSEVDFTNYPSFQAYLDARLFEYSRGRITCGEERVFLLEATALYLLELGLSDSKEKEIVWKSAFDVGKSFFAKFGDKSPKALSELLTALGWGIVSIVGSKTAPKVIVEHYPWTKYYDKINFIILAGILSGALSSIYDTNISFSKAVKDISAGHLNLVFKQ